MTDRQSVASATPRHGGLGLGWPHFLARWVPLNQISGEPCANFGIFKPRQQRPFREFTGSSDGAGAWRSRQRLAPSAKRRPRPACDVSACNGASPFRMCSTTPCGNRTSDQNCRYGCLSARGPVRTIIFCTGNSRFSLPWIAKMDTSGETSVLRASRRHRSG